MMISGLLVTIFLLFGAVNNATVIYLIYANELTQAAINLLVLNLSLSDLGLCVMFMPFSAASHFKERWMFGAVMCVVQSFLGPFFVRASLLTMTVIVYERYLRIIRRRVFTFSRRRCCVLLALIWLAAGLFSMPIYPRKSTYNDAIGNCYIFVSKSSDREIWRDLLHKLDITVTRVLPLLSVCFCFVKIYQTLHRRRTRVAPFGLVVHAARDITVAELQTARMTFLLAFFQLGLLLPFGITSLLLEEYGMSSVSRAWMTTGSCLVFANTAFKPVLYAVRRGLFRASIARRMAAVMERLARMSRRTTRQKPYVVQLKRQPEAGQNPQAKWGITYGARRSDLARQHDSGNPQDAPFADLFTLPRECQTAEKITNLGHGKVSADVILYELDL